MEGCAWGRGVRPNKEGENGAALDHKRWCICSWLSQDAGGAAFMGVMCPQLALLLPSGWVDGWMDG